jgi:transposase
MMPRANTRAMQAHLDEISRTVAYRSHAALLMDRAGWHITAKLEVPTNITIILLPSRSPELNPMENVWQYMRQNWLSNRVFETYADILDAGCDAWNRLIAQPDTITSIGTRKWAHIGQA